MLIAGLASGFVICFAPYLISVTFGEGFSQSYRIAVILALGPLGLTSGCAHLLLQAATNGKFARNVTAVGGVGLFAAAYVFMPHFGAEGAAAARTAVQLGVALLTLAWLGKMLGDSAGTRQNLRSFVLLVALAVSLALLIGAGPQRQIFSLLVLFSMYSCLVFFICSRIWEPNMFRKLDMLSESRNG
jgi:O-antigen/teichoic acid export membrane protein